MMPASLILQQIVNCYSPIYHHVVLIHFLLFVYLTALGISFSTARSLIFNGHASSLVAAYGI